MIPIVDANSGLWRQAAPGPEEVPVDESTCGMIYQSCISDSSAGLSYNYSE